MDPKMEHSVDPMSSSNEPIRVSEWVARQRPDLRQLVNTDPDPVLLDDNLVAFVADPDVGRDVALAFERKRTDLAEIATVVLGSAHDRRPPTDDAEGVTGHAARRALTGAVIGAVIFALVIGLATWLLFGGAAAVIGGAIGGALFGAGSGATWNYVIGTGQSAAYQETFVDPAAVEAVAVSVHANGSACIDAAYDAVTGIRGIELHRIDRDGQPRPE